MEEAIRIHNYFPHAVHYPAQQEYIKFLWDSYQSNDENDQHTFAYIAFHMLYMSAVYFMLWKVNMSRPVDFRHALIGFRAEHRKQILKAQDPFIFSCLNERQIFNLFELLKFDSNNIGKLKIPVDNRNKCAHPNGVITFDSQASLDKQISNILMNLKIIHSGSLDLTNEMLTNFLLTSWNPEENEYDNFHDEIEEGFIRENYLSHADLSNMYMFEIENLESDPNYDEINQLFQIFQQMVVDMDIVEGEPEGA